MLKLILKNHFSPGDVVMLTAAVRDLHLNYPGRFLTDVRTACPDIWDHNPYITKIRDDDPEAKVVNCDCKLINQSNRAPVHYVQAFVDSLNRALRLNIQSKAFKGDIHLSSREKSWHSQVHEVTGGDIPYWIIVSGGKFDATTKWWDPKRFQEVVDHFAGRIQFVQVGEWGHWHPRLEGVIDLRGQTTLRELIRLVYHAQGVLCGVTGLMHLAAAIESKPGYPPHRACVVIAGAREPVNWEAYPHHQYIHRNGALSCSLSGGCWKDRVHPLGDGDPRDKSGHLCLQPVGKLPRCQAMIAPHEVIGRIETFFEGGALPYLLPSEIRMARQGVRKTVANDYDQQILNLHSAGLECARRIDSFVSYPGTFKGKGIVIPGGGLRYFPAAWVCINMLRHVGCDLPIEFWHMGEGEMDPSMRRLLERLGVRIVDAEKLRSLHPVRRLGGWELKSYALLHSEFREVILLDADNVPVVDPAFLFETEQFKETGAIFWPDYGREERSDVIWNCLGIVRPLGLEFESGQIVVDKERCWKALLLAMWLNENSDFFYQHIHGDKETFHLAFVKVEKSFSFVPFTIHRMWATMCQRDFEGRRIFQHRNLDKWNLHILNRKVDGFLFDEECRHFLQELQKEWDGRSGKYIRKLRSISISKGAPPAIAGTMISCPERDKIREKTLKALSRTDWGNTTVLVQKDTLRFRSKQKRQTHTSFLALSAAVKLPIDYLIFFEDDLIFNQHILHNLHSWRWLVDRAIEFGSLYNPWLSAQGLDAQHNASFIDLKTVYGSQAFILSKASVKRVIENWDEVEGMQDIKISRLAPKALDFAVYHTPSLVQHVGKKSVWGGRFHTASDFGASWRADSRANSKGVTLY
jgi:ADP-heptose:LPS heptosyltransferase